MENLNVVSWSIFCGWKFIKENLAFWQNFVIKTQAWKSTIYDRKARRGQRKQGLIGSKTIWRFDDSEDK